MIRYITRPTPQAVLKLLERATVIDGEYRLVRGLLGAGQFLVWDAGQREDDVIDHRGFAEELNLDFDEVPADSQFRLYAYQDGRLVLEVPRGGLRHPFIAKIKTFIEKRGGDVPGHDSL